MKEVVNNVEIEVLSYEDTFMVSNEEVANTFGVGESAIRKHKMKEEFKAGKHFVTVPSSNSGGADKTMWLKKGIILLGFQLRATEYTIAFRDWASDYIINGGEVQPQLTDDQIVANALQITARRVEVLEDKNNALKGANQLLINKNEILFNEKEEAREEISDRDALIAHISDRSEAVSIDEWAKLIFDLYGITKMGRTIMFRTLRELDYLYYQQKKNKAYQRYINNGWFVHKDASYNHPRTGERVFEVSVFVTRLGMDKLTGKIVDYLREDV